MTASAEARGALRLAVEEITTATPTDWSEDRVVADVFADILMDLLDRLNDADVQERLTALVAEERGW